MTDKLIPLTEITKLQTEMLKGFAILLVMLGHTKYIVWGGLAE